jgi:hypothetical protein
LAVLLALGACSRDQAAEQAPSAPTALDAHGAASTAPWFICDGIDAPSIFVMAKSQDNARVLVTEYSKTDGRPAWRADFAIGQAEGAAGSVYTPLQRGDQGGQVRQINPGVLENPGSAFTPPYSSLTFGQRTITCRWLARTRFMGFDERRSFVVHEDADGDLIYTTYDFAGARAASPIDLAENSRTTGFSIEVRGGTEVTGPGGQEFRFENGEILYLVAVPTIGPATVEVWRGDNQIQSETMIAQQVGEGS